MFSKQLMISKAQLPVLLLGSILCISGVVEAALLMMPELNRPGGFECDFGPDAMSSFFGKNIPQTCIDVPVSSSSTTTNVEQRCFYTYVPEKALTQNTTNVPLLMEIHAFSSCPTWVAQFSGWMEMAEQEGFVVVWPISSQEDKISGRSCWNVPGFLKPFEDGLMTLPCCCTDDAIVSFIKGEDLTGDPDFLKMVIDKVIETSTEPSIDASRVYVTGHSNGAIVSLTMAALHSDTIAAVASFGGTVITPFAEDYTPVPIWMVHGMLDELVAYDGEIEKFGIDLLGKSKVGYFPFLKAASYIAEENGCSETEGVAGVAVRLEDTDTEVGEVITYPGCSQSVEILTLYTAGHYPYKAAPMINEYWATHDQEYPVLLPTTKMAWEFLSSHAKDIKEKSSSAAAPRSTRKIQERLVSVVVMMLGMIFVDGF